MLWRLAVRTVNHCKLPFANISPVVRYKIYVVSTKQPQTLSSAFTSANLSNTVARLGCWNRHEGNLFLDRHDSLIKAATSFRVGFLICYGFGNMAYMLFCGLLIKEEGLQEKGRLPFYFLGKSSLRS